MIDVFCVGTPDITGDALGPLVGTMLSTLSLDINVVGTIEDPVIRSNYNEQVKRLRPTAHLIVVDAVVGKEVGTYSVENGSLQPGEAVNAGVEALGDLAVRGVLGTTVLEMMLVSPWLVSAMAHAITTNLADLIETTQNKSTYIEIK
jgi:putative sporulation protein YyaC